MARTILSPTHSSVANKYPMFSNPANPIPIHTAYTMPSMYSSKYLFLRKKRYRQMNFASSSGTAANANAVNALSMKPTPVPSPKIKDKGTEKTKEMKADAIPHSTPFKSCETGSG